ncbi:hypothetical protein J4204_02965 [Candidatus Woesearchaeota archaeon]|nr:hypothetical protein [Candidatus Woesearchaeota archaeon]
MKSRLIDMASFSKLSLEERTAVLCSKLRVGRGELHEFSSAGGVGREDLIEAAVFLYLRLKFLGYSKASALSHITSGILGLVIFPNNNVLEAGSSAATAINKSFRNERNELEEEIGFSVTAPEILRIETFRYAENKELRINAVGARRRWGTKVEFSSYDLIRGIKLPMQITPYETAFLGAIYPQMSFVEHKNTVRMYDKDGKNRGLFKLLKIMSKDMFNIQNNNNNSSNLFLSSRAVYTWLTEILGLKKELDGRIFPEFNEICGSKTAAASEESFLYGLIARRALMYRQRKSPHFVINSSSRLFLTRVKDLSEKYELRPHLMTEDDGGGRGRLIYCAADVQTIEKANVLKGSLPTDAAYKGGFFNPSHVANLS